MWKTTMDMISKPTMQDWQNVNPLPYPHGIYIVKNTTNYMSEKRTTNFYGLKEQTL